MTPSKNTEYIRIYEDKKGKIIIYSGVTNNMKRRQEEHKRGLCRTTNRYNKSFKLLEIRYKSYENVTMVMLKALEKKFKKLKTFWKLEVTHSWKRWTG